VTTLQAYRDDGPLAGPMAMRRVPGPTLLVVAVALMAVAIGISTAEAALAFPAFTLFVVAGLWSAMSAVHPKLGWFVPPVLRIGEYGILLWIALWGVIERPAAVFALLVAVAFHHYDIVYRLRHQRVAPPDWVRLAGGGWEGRTILVLVAVAMEAVDVVVIALAIWCGLLFVAESLVSWLRVARDEQREVAQSLEDEEEIF